MHVINPIPGSPVKLPKSASHLVCPAHLINQFFLAHSRKIALIQYQAFIHNFL
jgi:hypothetical protein